MVSVYSAEEKMRLAMELERLEAEHLHKPIGLPSHYNNTVHSAIAPRHHRQDDNANNYMNHHNSNHHHNNKTRNVSSHMRPPPQGRTSDNDGTRTNNRVSSPTKTQKPAGRGHDVDRSTTTEDEQTPLRTRVVTPARLSNMHAKHALWLSKRDARRAEMRADREHKELNECTFQPNVNAKYRSYSTTDVVDRLTTEHEERMAKKSIQRAAAEKESMQDCTFRPNIVADEWTERVTPRYLDPMEPNHRTPVRASGGGGFDEKCTFTPKINRSRTPSRGVSSQRYLTEGVFDRLARRREASSSAAPTPSVTSATPSRVISKDETSEFLRRMEEHNRRKQLKAQRAEQEEREQRLTFAPKLTEKSKELARSITPFASRCSTPHATPGRGRRPRGGEDPSLDGDAVECTFAPRINDYHSATAQPRSHSPDELCYRWNERRQNRIDAARREKEMEEAMQMPFHPRTSSPPSHCNVSLSQRSVISNPHVYMQKVTAEQIRKERLRAEHQRVALDKEMEECTFRPNVRDSPRYTQTIAAAMALARRSRDPVQHPHHTFGYS